MTAVCDKAMTSFGFADVSKQLFHNPYTRISATLSLADRFLSSPVTCICHSRDENTFELFKSYYSTIINFVIRKKYLKHFFEEKENEHM